MTLAEKIQLILSYLISLSLVLAIIGAIIAAQWFNAFLAGLAFFLTYTPAIIERNFKIFIPIEFELMVIVFVYASIYLGSIRGYYQYFWWWDIFLHAFSGALLGMVGFLIIYILNSERRFNIRLGPLFVGLFSFVFAVALGGLWEIFEFVLDLFFGFELQASSLIDTMTDLIVDSAGALFIAIVGALYVKNVRASFMSTLITKFVRKNPKLFGRWH